MKLSEIVARLNGVSTPIGGVSWTPPQVDVDVARAVLLFLEDRRALYNPYEVEMPEHVIASVIEIRKFLTDRLTAGGIADDLAGHLRSMRAAARQFLDRLPPEKYRQIDGFSGSWGMSDPVFNQALGEMRGAFGVHIRDIAVRFGLDVPEPLAEILPPTDNESSP